MAWIGAIAQGVGTTINAPAAGKQASVQNKKIKNALSDYPYVNYGGLRPPRIDANGKEYLRPTQDMTQQIIMDRAQGKGVGYDPERMRLLTDLVKSENQQRREDDVRAANGRLSSSGLSGNPRAYEALAGRVNRDSARSLNDNLAKISIEDLTRANEERDVNTARLQDLNSFNFGQENNAADFDLNVWKAEESAKQGRVGLGFQAADRYRDPASVMATTFGNSLVNLGSQMYGGGSGGGSSPTMSSPTTPNYGGFAGYGLQPTNSNSFNNNWDSYTASKSGRRLGGK